MRFRGSNLVEINPLEYRSAATTAASATVTKPAGIAVGDVVVVVAPDSIGLTLTTFGGSAWTRDEIAWLGHSYRSVAFIKVLNATDVSNNWNLSASTPSRALAWIGNDAGGGSVKAQAKNNDGQSSLTITGFTPSNTHGTISIVVDRDETVSPVAPSGFTVRSTALVDHWIVAAADHDGYTGDNATWTGLSDGVNNFAEVGWLFEVTPG